MFHSTSGKYGFEPHVVQTLAQFTREELIKVLIEEDSLRASQEIQDQYTNALMNFDWTTDDVEHYKNSQSQMFKDKMEIVLERLADITTQLQETSIWRHIPKEKINSLGIQECLKVLRNARFQFQDDPEINQLTVYQRSDRSRKGNLMIGSQAPNILLNVINDKMSNNSEVELLSLQQGKPLVLMCGSVS